MTNSNFKSIDECRDIESVNFYNEALKKGEVPSQIILKIRKKGRDNARTPVQWNGEVNAGFSNGKPWIDVNPDYKRINAENEENDADSVLTFYKKMIKLRKNNPVLVYGEYKPLEENSEQIMAYYRALDGEKMLTVLNFSKETAKFAFGGKKHSLIISNYKDSFDDSADEIELEPYEALVFKIIG
jgi:oligo-1,6-glucosidase/glucan 1,6-alpha-glucosidase